MVNASMMETMAFLGTLSKHNHEAAVIFQFEGRYRSFVGGQHYRERRRNTPRQGHHLVATPQFPNL